VVQILPPQVASGDLAAFSFRVLNSGVVNVVNFKISGEYFVRENTKKLIQPVERANINPNSTIGALRAGEEETFDVGFSNLVEQVVAIDEVPMKILKLSFTYQREIDGTGFSTSRLYWITGSGNSLTDFDALDTTSNTIMVTERIKSILSAPAIQ